MNWHLDLPSWAQQWPSPLSHPLLASFGMTTVLAEE